MGINNFISYRECLGLDAIDRSYHAIPKLKYAVGNSGSTTLSSSVSDSDTALPLTSTTNFDDAPTPGEGMYLIDEGTASEELAYGTGLSGSSATTPLANRGAEGTSAAGHSASATVRGPLTAGMWNDLVTSLINVLVQSTGAVDNTKVPVVSGGYATTLTTTASTDVTLPTTGTLATLAGTETLTNKWVKPRTNTVASSATPTINTDTTDIFTITALAADITSMTSNLSGTPVNGQKLIIRIKDDGTSRAITWGTSFASRGATLPTATTISKTHYVGLIWNSTASKWDCVAAIVES